MPQGDGLEQDLYQAPSCSKLNISYCLYGLFFLIFDRIGLMAVRLSEHREVSCSVVRKGSWAKPGCSVTAPSLHVVLENDRAIRMLNKTHRKDEGRG